MIVSHRHRFIFIKTHKTAGSSMEMALAPLCGPEDIITPMESNRDSGLPRNFHPENTLGRAYAASRLLRKTIHRESRLISPWYWEHMPALRVRELVGRKTWDSYHKFCYERNPWAKVVSYYNWKKHGQGRTMPAFRDYVLHKTRRLPMDARLYFEGETCLVDEVLDFEGFAENFPALCRRLGIPFEGPLPREKTGIRQEKSGDYRGYYDPDTRAKVEECFRREIGLKQYRF